VREEALREVVVQTHHALRERLFIAVCGTHW